MQAKKRNLGIFILLGIITILFFHKTFLKKLIPFPGDLLVSEYQPFRSYSYGGFNPGAVPNKAQYYDTIREFYPWRTFTNTQIKKGQLPFWDPYSFSGTPHLANFHTAVFYPANIIYSIFDQITAWTILIILQPLLASIFMYLYATTIGLGFYPAILCAIAFSYSSYMNTWLEFNTIGHAISWFPLILYSIEKIFKQSGKNLIPWILLLIFSLTFSLFAGHPIDFALIYLFSILYLAFRIFILNNLFQKKIILFIKYFSIMIIPLIIASVQLFPTIKLLQNSNRVAFEYDFFINKMLIQPYQLIAFFIPDFFGNPATRNFWLKTSYVDLTLSVGLIPLLFVIYVLTAKISTRQFFRKKYFVFFTFSTLTILLFVINSPLTRFLYKIQIPLFSNSSPSKLLLISSFSLSILAGFGLDLYLKNKLKLKKQFIYLLPLIIFFALAWISLKLIPDENFKTSFRNTVYSTSILGIGLILFLTPALFKNFINPKKLITVSALLLIFLTIADLKFAFNKFNPFSPREFIFPETGVLNFLQKNSGINRFWGYGTAKIDSNIATQYGLFSTDGFDALNLRLYNEFISSSKNGKIKTRFSHLDRSIAEIFPGYGETDLPNNQYRLRIFDALGVKYILDRIENPQNEKTFPPERFKLIWEDSAGWKVFENLKVAPRFFLTSDIKTYSTNAEFEKIFFAKDFNSAETILIHKSDFNKIAMTDYNRVLSDKSKIISQSSVKLLNYSPNQIVFKVDTKLPVFLFLSDTYHPDWKAYIDNQETKIYKTNYAFRSVFIPKGSHKINFIYKLSIFSPKPFLNNKSAR